MRRNGKGKRGRREAPKKTKKNGNERQSQRVKSTAVDSSTIGKGSNYEIGGPSSEPKRKRNTSQEKLAPSTDEEDDFAKKPKRSLTTIAGIRNVVMKKRTPSEDTSSGGESESEPDGTGNEEREGDEEEDGDYMPLQRQSVLRRHRRAAEREEDLEGRRREALGLRAVVVEVNPTGMIDGGCAGHEKWNLMVRRYTPQILSMAEDDIIKQLGDLRSLRGLMFDKF